MCPMEKVDTSKSRLIMKWGRDLPSFIGETIFSKLVISNLPSCRLVCKTWNEIVLGYASSSKFQFLTNVFLLFTSDRVPNCKFTGTCNSKMHCINLDTKKYSDVDFDLELEFTKSGSLQFDGNWSYIIMMNQCNGLVFISKNTFYCSCDGIFNPMTNEFIQVPEFHEDIHVFGFGFSPTTIQYKLFRVADTIAYSKSSRTIVSNTQESTSTMDVLTFGRSRTNPNNNQWRHLHTLSFEKENACNGAYLNGVIYWLVKEKRNDEKKMYVIYALDVETEQIELRAVLQEATDLVEGGTIYKYKGTIGRIYQFNGTIYTTFYINSALVSKTIEIWRMRENESWIREFVIDDTPNYWKCLELIKIFENGDILCMINMDFFCFYNRFTKRKKIVPKNQRKSRYICQIDSLNFGSLREILEGQSS